ncbi:hypothetical protein [Dasineura jujubifolia toursvirus 2a]|nr:hypothetical protein [Dasineura jujubifolia toursvirus 2a]
MEFLGNIEQNKYLTPDVKFSIDLYKSFEFLDNYITNADFEKIKDLSDKYNYKLFKNPALILVSFIIVKWGNYNEITFPNIKKLFSSHDISPILKENHISIYDIVRYSRFIILHLKDNLNF